MQNYYLVHKIPKAIEGQLKTLCFGPPQINWVDANHFYFFIHSLGMLTDLDLSLVRTQLQTLFFLPFNVNLKNLTTQQTKGKGVIGIESELNEDLMNFKKEIYRLFRNLNLKKVDSLPFPIVLGYFEKINFEKLNDYLTYSSFSPQPLLITELILLRTWSSSKRMVYEELDSFPASTLGCDD
jgi:2'-5' RNA ligase